LHYTWNNEPSTWGWNSELGLPEYQWVLVALVIEPNQATMYVRNDAQLFSATNSVANNLEEFDGVLYFGRDPHNGIRLFVGWLDDVRIYDRALPATEIEQLYAKASMPPAVTAAISREGNNALLSWTGGSPPYQVQIKTNLSSVDWQVLGMWDNTNSILITRTNAAAFYRIIGY